MFSRGSDVASEIPGTPLEAGLASDALNLPDTVHESFFQRMSFLQGILISMIKLSFGIDLQLYEVMYLFIVIERAGARFPCWSGW
jgi:hypothetical protein